MPRAPEEVTFGLGALHDLVSRWPLRQAHFLHFRLASFTLLFHPSASLFLLAWQVPHGFSSALKVVGSFAATPTGTISARIGNKRPVVIGLFLIALASVFGALAPSLIWLLVSRLVEKKTRLSAGRVGVKAEASSKMEQQMLLIIRVDQQPCLWAMRPKRKMTTRRLARVRKSASVTEVIYAWKSLAMALTQKIRMKHSNVSSD